MISVDLDDPSKSQTDEHSLKLDLKDENGIAGNSTYWTAAVSSFLGKVRVKKTTSPASPLLYTCSESRESVLGSYDRCLGLSVPSTI